MCVVGRLIVEWEEANPGQDFRGLIVLERNCIWEVEYKNDLIGICKSMWSPVKSVVDWHAMFVLDINDLSAEEKRKIKWARRILLVKVVAACDVTFLYRYHGSSFDGYLGEGDSLVPIKVSFRTV